MPDTSYESFAEQYDQNMGETGDIFHQQKIDPALFSLLGRVEDFKIYDIGCGNGYLDNLLLQKGVAKIWASDISPKLIELAKQRFESQNKDKLTFFEANGNDFTFFGSEFDNTFDVVISNMAVHYIQNIESFAKNVSQLLKANGKFVCTLAHPFDDFKFHQRLSEFDRQRTARKYLTHYSHEVAFFKDKPFQIYKRPISFYVNTFAEAGLLLSGMQEISKFAKIDGKFEDTKIPAFLGMKFERPI
jgi:ubiquinone/menaquinone biosynthesis C-methylase UbiE